MRKFLASLLVAVWLSTNQHLAISNPLSHGLFAAETDPQIKIYCDAAYKFFDGLSDKGFTAGVCDEFGRPPPIDGQFTVENLNSIGFRCCYFVSRSTPDSLQRTDEISSFRRFEGLFYYDSQWISALSEIGLDADDDEVRSKLRFLAGGTDWKSSAPPFSYHMVPLTGLVWRNQSALDLKDLGFWEATGRFRLVDESRLQLVDTDDLSKKISFEFEKVDGKVFFAGLEIDYPQIIDMEDGKIRKETRILAERVEYSIETDTAALKSYVYSYDYLHHGQNKSASIHVIVDAIEPVSNMAWLRFVNSKVSEGANVIVPEDQWSKYQFHNGRLSKLIDTNAVRAIENLYFEKTSQSPDTKTVELVATLDNGRKVACILTPCLSERNSLPHCGIYSLAAVAASYGVWMPIEELLGDGKLSSQFGSNAEALIRFAERKGLNAKLIQSLDISTLRTMNKPALLHFSRGVQAEGIDHWVAYLGEQDGKSMILDLPHDVQPISPALLMTYWDGTAISVNGGGRSTAWKWSWLSYVKFSCLFLLVLATVIVADRIAINSAICQLSFICFLILSFTAFWQFLSPVSFKNNIKAVNLVKSKSQLQKNNFAVEVVPRSKFLEAVKTVDLIVDCRYPTAYFKSHIDGSVNMPVDASLVELNRILPKLENVHSAVCYCQSENCQWAKIVGGRLLDLGIDRVSVFEPGWSEIQFMESVRKTGGGR